MTTEKQRKNEKERKRASVMQNNTQHLEGDGGAGWVVTV
jgi:hypothetical protein